MALHDAGALEEFADEQLRVVQLGGHEVGIVRRGGHVCAIRNACPHQSGPLCAGSLRADLTGNGAGHVTVRAGSLVVACPWHGWEFDVDTGRSTWDPSFRAKTYAASVCDGHVLVEIGGSR
jgi:nitrite reductase/ring-hydroxylating ferredoxin subunit